jgi:hypothetical protein
VLRHAAGYTAAASGPCHSFRALVPSCRAAFHEQTQEAVCRLESHPTMQHVGDAHLEPPQTGSRAHVGPKSTALQLHYTMKCRQLRTMSPAEPQSESDPAFRAPPALPGRPELTFARSLPALTDLTILDMPSRCDSRTFLLADLTKLTAGPQHPPAG